MSPKAQKAAFAAVLFAAVAAAYLWTAGHGFVYDDREQVLRNPWIREIPASLNAFVNHSLAFLDDSYYAISYRPLVFFVYSLEYALFALDPRGWHLVNVAVHGLNAVLVFLLISRLLGRGPEGVAHGGSLLPFAATLVFALHPANAEAASWVGCVPELFFTLITLSVVMMEARPEGLGVFGRALTGLLFLAALLFKETAVVLPVLVFALDLSRNGVARLFSLRRIAPYVPYVLGLSAYVVLRSIAIERPDGPSMRLHGFLTGAQFALNSAVLFARYLFSLAVPALEAPFQLLDPVYSLKEPRALVSAAFAVLAPIVLISLSWKKDRRGLLASALLMLPLLPSLYSPAVSRFPFADRYMYMPSIGLALFLAIAIERLAARKESAARAASVALIAVAVAFSIAAVKRSAAWRDDATLWTTALDAQPGNYAAAYALGSGRMEAGDMEGAERLLEEALRGNLESAHPDQTMVLLNRKTLTTVYLRNGRVDKAEDNLVKYLAMAPEDPEAGYNLGLIYQRKGRCPDAVEAYLKAALFVVKPRLRSDINYNLGECYMSMGMRKEALSSYASSLRDSPGDAGLAMKIRALGGAAP